jgi:RimJ/RimL family protein N-acetyltransferase
MLSLPTILTDKAGHPYLVRRYAPSDRRALEAMYADFEPKRAAQGLPPEGEAKVRRWLDRILAAGEHLVVEREGEILGHAMLVPMEGGAAELANFLHQSIRGRGVGTALNRVIVQLGREAGYIRVWLSVEPSNRAALKSYERAGFHLLPGAFWAPEVEMEVRIQDSASRIQGAREAPRLPPNPES